MHVIKEKPGTLVAAPFLVIIGLDLVANIFFLAKRTYEFFVFGIHFLFLLATLDHRSL